MYRDPLIRSYHDTPPLFPFTQLRFFWPDPYDADVLKIRTEVQEGGPGLYVLYGPDYRKLVVEAYYPEDIRPGFYRRELDPLRKQDYQQGRLVVVHEYRLLGPGGVDGQLIAEIRRNNRHTRSELRRTHSSVDRAIALREEHEAQEQAILSEYMDAFADAVLETRGQMKPRNTSTRRIAA